MIVTTISARRAPASDPARGGGSCVAARQADDEGNCPFVRQNLRRYLSVPNHEDLVILKELVEAGKLTPVIDRKYPLHETPAALGYIEGGHARGKVVITLSHADRGMF